MEGEIWCPQKSESHYLWGVLDRYEVLLFEDTNYVEDALTVGQGIAHDTAVNNASCIPTKEC